MAETVYILCALTSVACAALLWRGYRRTKARLLLWSSLCFVGLGANNVLLLADKVVFPDVEYVFGVHFMVWRTTAALAGLALLVVGLVWEVE